MIANFVGWLFSRHPQPEELLTSRFQDSCKVHSHPPHQDRNVQELRMFGAEANAILPALVVGCAMAGFIQVAVSRDLLLTLGQYPVWSVLALMGLAFVIAICSTVDALFVLRQRSRSRTGPRCSVKAVPKRCLASRSISPATRLTAVKTTSSS